MKTGRWSLEGTAPSRPEGLEVEASTLQAGSKKIIFQPQKIDGVEIEGTYYKEISSKDPEFITYKWSEPLPLNLRAHLVLMKSKKDKIQEDFFKRHPEFKSNDLVGQPEIVIHEDGPRWKFVFQKANGRLEGVYLDRHQEIRSRKELGSGYVKAAATLFPSGPLKSQLEKVILEDLLENRTLTSPQIKVTTQSNVKALSENSLFAFPVDDRRFEQVQAFFYLTRAMEWCKENLNFQLPFTLEAETSVGYPERTNAAFYYQRKVRLGDGDDAVFSRIPMDPSIVMHEAFHGVVDAVARLPHEGEGGSINEGFSDFFTSVILDNPNMAEASYKKAPFKRTLNNEYALADKNGGLYHDSGIISGLLWAIRKNVGSDLSVQIAWNTLLRLTPDSLFDSFKLELLEEIDKLPESQKAKVRSVLQQRGWLD